MIQLSQRFCRCQEAKQKRIISRFPGLLNYCTTIDTDCLEKSQLHTQYCTVLYISYITIGNWPPTGRSGTHLFYNQVARVVGIAG